MLFLCVGHRGVLLAFLLVVTLLLILATLTLLAVRVGLLLSLIRGLG